MEATLVESSTVDPLNTARSSGTCNAARDAYLFKVATDANTGEYLFRNLSK